MSTAIAPWPPTRWTRPLSENFPSLWDTFGPVINDLWEEAFHYRFEDWQNELLRHQLEIFPLGHPNAGELRFPTALTSMARQQGKTECETAFAMVGLLFHDLPTVVGVAFRYEQANELYKRARALIDKSALSKRFNKTTETRGLKPKWGGTYKLLPSVEKSLQSYAIDFGVADEVHLLSTGVWTAMTIGTGGRPNSQIAGITTAGDQHSELLLNLYELAEKAIALPPEDNDFFVAIWEAPDTDVPKDDDTLYAYLQAAGPAVASGRIPRKKALSEAKKMPREDLVRYKFNRFIDSTSAFISNLDWLPLTAPPGYTFPRAGNRVFVSVDRDPNWESASFVAAVKPDGQDKTHTQYIARMIKPSPARIADRLEYIWNHNQVETILVDWYSLPDVIKILESKGIPVQRVTNLDQHNAGPLFYSKIKQRKLVHGGDAELDEQVPMATRKTKGDGWRIVSRNKAIPVDGVIATAIAVNAVETYVPPAAPQLYL